MGTRRHDDEILDSLYELARVLPWWLDLGLAAASGVGLHQVATAPRTTPATTTTEVAHQVSSTLWQSLAGIGQFIVPLVFVAGATASLIARRRRVGLLRKAGEHGAKAAIGDMSWQDFERLVHELLRRRGFAVEALGGGQPDGGIDLVARRAGEVTLVQCKHWRTKRVGVTVVRELLGVVTARGATAGTVVTSGAFTDEAKRFASGQRIELIDGAALRSAARSLSLSMASPASPSTTAPTEICGPPACPTCGRAMVQRLARRGAHAGNRFWGCPSFPSCRGTRSIEQAHVEGRRVRA